MISESLKEMIRRHLEAIIARRDSFWGLGIKYFLQDIENKTEKDYLQLIQYVKDGIRDNKADMLGLIGEESMKFFLAIEHDKELEEGKAKIAAAAQVLMKSIQEFRRSFNQSTAAGGLCKSMRNNDEISEILIHPGMDLSDILKQIAQKKRFPPGAPETHGIKNSHIDKVGEVYESLKDSLNNLFADLQPANWNQSPIDSRISNVFEKITTLRNLACIGR